MDKLISQFKNSLKQDKFKKHLLTNPHKHWVIILKVCFAMILGLIAFNLYLLYKIKNEQIFQVTKVPEQNINPIKEKLLNSVNASFDNKENKIIELKKNPPSYPDPSL